VVRMLVYWTVTALFLSGCAPTLPPLPPPAAQLELSAVIAQRQQLPNPAYTFGPEDVLRITVYDHPDLSHEVTIAADGAFTYPLLGKFQVAGLTIQELEQRLTQRLADGYLVNPQLTVVVLQYRSNHAYVIGAVQKPGVYPLHSNLTLLELISQAGGITTEAGWYAVLVHATQGTNGSADTPQTGQKNPVAVHIDLDKLFAGQLPQPLRIASGDTIYVPLVGYVFVSGEVLRPGRYRLERGLTVHKVITLAGGFSKFAAEKRLRVKRTVDGESREFQAHLDDHLQAEDVLIIPESTF
jgi:polysaccharide biosynthesis/export protein